MMFDLMKKNWISLLVILFCFTAYSNAQVSLYMNDPDAIFKNGILLFENGQLLAARHEFEQYLHSCSKPTNNEQKIKLADAQYYIGAVAVDLQQPDAEKILLDVLRNSIETRSRRLAYFQLGKLAHQKSKFDDCISWFNQVSKNDLTNTERIEYNFKLAYAYFVTKDFDKAKPLFREVKGFNNSYTNDANYYYGYISFADGDYSSAQNYFETIQNIDSYKSTIPYYLAQIYFVKKNYSKVISYAAPYANDPNFKYQTDMFLLLGQSYYYLNDYTNATTYLKKYSSKTPKVKKEVIYQLAFSQYKTNQLDDAISNFRSFSIVDDSLGQNAMYALANCYLKKENKEEAKTAYASAMRMNGDAYVKQLATANYIKLCYDLGEYTTVVSTAPNYINSYASSNDIADMNQMLATALLQTKNYKDAIKVIEGIKTKNASLNKAYQQVCYYQGVQEFNDKNTEASLVLLDKSLTYPIDKELQAEAIFLKAEMFYNKQQYEKAAVEYDKYIQIAPNSYSSNAEQNLAQAHYFQGYSYFKQKKYEAAKGSFSKALRLVKANDAPSYLSDLHLRLADCYYITKDFTAALPEYSYVMKLPVLDNDYAMFQSAMIYGFMNRDKDKVATLQNLTTQFPSSTIADKAWYERGITYQQDLEDVSAAQNAFSHIITSYPTSSYVPLSTLRLGLIQFNLGNKEKALSYYKEVVQNYPKSDYSKEALGIMQEIYVTMGNPDAYIQYLQQANIDVSASVQDSLFYKSAEERYFNADYTNAIPAFETYINKFANGFFIDEAHYYVADCYYKAKDFNNALSKYQVLEQKKSPVFYERALKRCATISYLNNKDYVLSVNYYTKLYTIYKGKDDEFAYLMNAMRSAYLAKKDNELLLLTDDVVKHSKTTTAEQREARYYRAGVFIERNQLDNALTEYNYVASGPASEQTSEANYYLAYGLFAKKQYQASLDKAFEVKEKVEGYDYWLAKLFILIGDAYAMLGNNYQAQATYESILENYDGDKELIQEIKQKLEVVKMQSIQKSIIDLGSDSLQTLPLEENK